MQYKLWRCCWKSAKQFVFKTGETITENIHNLGFAAHIFHDSGVCLREDILPLDIEAILHKTFQYFHIYAVGV